MSVSDISSHLDDLYGYQLSEQTISNITEAIMDKAKDWQNRPLEAIYPIVFMDATVLKIRVDRVVKNIAAYIMLGITLEGKKEILGIWIGINIGLRELYHDGVKINDHPLVGINHFNKVGVTDGRHRITHAAELGKKIQVAIHPDDIEKMREHLK